MKFDLPTLLDLGAVLVFTGLRLVYLRVGELDLEFNSETTLFLNLGLFWPEPDFLEFLMASRMFKSG